MLRSNYSRTEIEAGGNGNGNHVLEPIRGDRGASILGPRNPPLERENPDMLASPYTDAGTIPNLKFSFSAARNRLATGGWAREVTVRELPISTSLAGVNVRAFVLESGNVGAYAWPDGSIFLTSALVEMLEPQEITAVLAHELGHLSDHQIFGNASSLLGKAQHLDDESRADAFACDLLRRSGFAPHALASALQKVRAAAGLSTTTAIAAGSRSSYNLAICLSMTFQTFAQHIKRHMVIMEAYRSRT